MQINPNLMNPDILAGPDKMVRSLNAAKQAGKQEDPQAVAQACLECEAMFISHLLKQLRQGMLSGELAAGGQRQEKFWAIADQEFSRHLASSGSLGLGHWLYRQLSRETTKQPSYQPLPDRQPAGPAESGSPEAIEGGGEVMTDYAPGLPIRES